VVSPLDDHELDAFYVAFENQFRGSRELIKERLHIYLNDVKDAGLGNSGSPVLDLGCGRGEWLELLTENGFSAEGVDLNAIMVAECKERGFRVTEGDALEYLRSLPAESQGVITAFHVIEHLEFRMLVELLRESLRVLHHGGLAIFETPNPDNVLVGSNRFYTDPTHRHPLPKEYTSFLLRSVGFTDVVIRPLHPDKGSLLNDGEAPKLRDLINRLFFGDQDYAVLGRKQPVKLSRVPQGG
jgi:O-antigen chain-terminating methyltransferase